MIELDDPADIKNKNPPCNHLSHGGFDLLEADLIQPQTC